MNLKFELFIFGEVHIVSASMVMFLASNRELDGSNLGVDT
jgi:hypothetical protein